MRSQPYSKPLAAILLFFASHALVSAQEMKPAQNAADTAGDGNSRAASAGRNLIGQPGPTAAMTTIDGAHIDLASFYGKKPVYLKFWATWCVPCREQMPGFERIYEKYGDRIAIIAVNTGFSETEADVRAYRAKHGLRMPIVIDDGSLGRKLNLRVTPQHVLIGADGRIEYVGHAADRQLDAALQKLMSEKPGRTNTAFALPASEPAALKVGDQVNGITLGTTDGRSVSLTPGKAHALVFFSPWCETYLAGSRPAVARACRRVRIESERLARQPNVEWFAISAPLWTSNKELAEYGKANKTTIPLVLDRSGDIFGAFGIRQFPSVVLIDAHNRVAQVLGPNDTGLGQAVQQLKQR
ncbi:redoxin family protein [Massilia solisilvae]|uniref:Redoxin family protein n=1 Tax=Massilia solisilvae TaxID=1811225 RepID=A0ABT2BGJ1_9BURK|nr:redoxin family protein [Massilia solisilvae]MCS0607637.1 redoxin family protein [Massilia solisilvae]